MHEIDALLVQFLHRHFRRHSAQGIDELAFHQFLELLRLHGAQAQRLGRRGDGILVGGDAHVELGDHIDPHAVLGDQCLIAAAADFEAQRVHVDGDHVVHDGQHEGAAAQHHLLAAEAGAHEGPFLGAAQVEPVQQPDRDRHDDRDDDQREDETSELSA